MTLNIQNLSKRYGDVAVFSNVSLAVAAGEFVAIVGESGVGKSTLLNCMAGLDTWDTGSVSLAGIDLATLDDDRRALLRRDKVGFVFQAFHVLPHLDVAQNVALPLLLQGGVLAGAAARSSPNVRAPLGATTAQAIDERVQAMLDAVGLEGLGARLPQQLSGGQLQRVSIARALVHRPTLLLADEPTGNLDPTTAARVMDALISQTRLHNAALVLVTHSEAAAARADRVLKLHHDGIF
jgi:putative ABC transport system ATP-binding protein